MYTIMEKVHNGKPVPSLSTLKNAKTQAAFKQPIVPAFVTVNLIKFEPFFDLIVGQLTQRLEQEFASI